MTYEGPHAKHRTSARQALTMLSAAAALTESPAAVMLPRAPLLEAPLGQVAPTPSRAAPRPPLALPLTGAEVIYFPECIPKEAASRLFADIDRHANFQKRPILLKDRETGRFFEALEGRPTISFSIPPGREYSYSGSWRVAEEFPQCVLDAKAQVEATLRAHLISWGRIAGREPSFNYCLANKYENGTQSVGKHADDEPDIVRRSPIATLSLGATRTFVLQPKGDLEQSFKLPLCAGSVLLMAGATQENFVHSIPKDKKVQEARISLTFRINI